MRISVSLPEEDIRLLDEQYAQAFSEWNDSPDAGLWDNTAADSGGDPDAAGPCDT